MSLPINPAFVVTTEELPGYRIAQTFGTAEGLGVTFYIGILPGGQKQPFIETLREALLELIASAARYLMPSSDEERMVLAYGTAVRVEKL
jgi:uncharacterized protein YbjQ (UPF0145 family)